MLTKEAIAEAVKEEWFQDLQDEIARTVKRRKSASNPALKPHGTLLGQTFIDRMNQEHQQQAQKQKSGPTGRVVTTRSDVVAPSHGSSLRVCQWLAATW